MTQVSKKFLRREIEAKVYQTFWETIVKTNKTEEASAFFSEFFSKSEKVNFAKRLSIAVLLHKAYGWREISDMLKVSLTTVAKVATKKDSKGFKIFFDRVDKDEAWQAFWKDLAKTYLALTHPEKYARLGSEGVEAVYFGKKKTL